MEQEQEARRRKRFKLDLNAPVFFIPPESHNYRPSAIEFAKKQTQKPYFDIDFIPEWQRVLHQVETDPDDDRQHRRDGLRSEINLMQCLIHEHLQPEAATALTQRGRPVLALGHWQIPKGLIPIQGAQK